MNRPPEDALEPDPQGSVRSVVAQLSIADASGEQVALAHGQTEVAARVVSARRDVVELEAPIFLPRRCQVTVRIDEDGLPPELDGVVRKSQLLSTDPTYAISIQLEGAGVETLARLAALTAEKAERQLRLAPALEASRLPGWATRLVAEEAVSEAQMDEAAGSAERAGVTLNEALLEAGIVDAETLAVFVNMDLGVPYVDPRAFDVRTSNASMIPEALARRHVVFPLFRIDNVLTLAMADPTDLALVDQVRLRENCHVDPCLCTGHALRSLIERAYGDGDVSGATAAPERVVEEVAEPSTNKVVRQVQSLIEEATRNGASDVHIEPERDLLRVRSRIDGILREQTVLSRGMLAPVVSRIKVAAKLDIAETRRPQDGHFGMKVDGAEVDVRVSTIPTVHGENVVLRLMKSEGKAISLDELKMAPAALEKLKFFLDHPHGMILVTGPTGSGKTTTLYASLARLNTMERSVVTVEDPVERRVPLLRQTQVNAKAGLTFAAGLRSILRQDPDIVMVGEIRDVETAEISVQAALTGHLVLSTLHTNTAAGAVVRLSEMGIAPFMITSSLRAVLGQRLVRRICDACKREVKPDPHLAAGFGLDDDVHLMQGAGCQRCLQTGYSGRIGVYELLEITPGLGQALLSGASRDAIEQEASSANQGGLWRDGLRRAREGHTTLEEVARVVGTPTAEELGR